MGQRRCSSVILYLCTRWMWVVSLMCLTLYPQWQGPSTHWIGGWVGPRTGLGAVEKWNLLHCRRSNPGRSASSPSLYRLSYPGLICLEGPKNTTINFIQDSRCPVWDSNWEPSNISLESCCCGSPFDDDDDDDDDSLWVVSDCCKSKIYSRNLMFLQQWLWCGMCRRVVW
jgi:hypothetical protein